MFIDNHVHLVGASAALLNLGDKIKRIEDVILLNTRYPEIYKSRLTDEPVDISGELIKVMDQHDIRHAIIQQTTGKGSNELLAKTVKNHPDRFSGLIRLKGGKQSEDKPADRRPGNFFTEEELAANRSLAVAEIIKGVEELGLIGVGEFKARRFTMEVHPEKIALDLKPIMDTVARYKIPVMIPTAWTQYPHGLFYGDPVWTDEIAYSYPEVPIILTKMGRGLHHFETALSVAMRNVNVYFDTVSTTPEHIRKAVDRIGAERIMFGTDWSPTWRWVSEPADLYTMHKKLLEDANLSPGEREQIQWRTAAKVFKLKVS